MTKKVLLTFLVIWLFSNTGSAQILKNTWIINHNKPASNGKKRRFIII